MSDVRSSFAGPGIYDSVCGTIHNSTQAKAVALVVIEGNQGSGFSVHAPLAAMPELAIAFELVAKQIREQLASLGPGAPRVQ